MNSSLENNAQFSDESQWQDIEVIEGQGDESGILWIYLSRLKSKNAISLEMIDSMEKVLALAEKTSRIRVIILGARGDCFCSGGDIKDMLEQKGMFAGDSVLLRENYKRGIQRIPMAIEAVTKPIIAMVDGPASGAGCDLACMADLRMASEKASFTESFARLALVPGDGGTFFLSRVIGHSRAMEMFLTCDEIKGEKALNWGLINRLVPSCDLELETKKWAKQIASLAPLALRLTKEALKRSRFENLSSQLDLLATYQSLTQRTPDHIEGLKALKEKRPPVFGRGE